MTRPQQLLIATTRHYPKLNQLIDDFRQSKGKDLPNWASFCFLPIAGWYAILCNFKRKYQLDLSDMQDLQVLSAVGTWQFSKGVYEFDSDLYQALIDSEITGDLPAEVLHKLPEWCLYVVTPDLQFDGQSVHGFYAYLEHDMNDGHHELRILLDCDSYFISTPLHIGTGTLLDAVDKYLFESARQGVKRGQDIVMPIDTTQNIANDIMPFLSLLLYICSSEPDLTNRDKPNDSPSRPQPTKTKKGWRLFPAEKVKTWTVGRSVGEQLRQTYQDYNTTGKTVKAHLRRGHHKTYWTGKRGTDEQKPVSRWIPPAIVGGK